METPIDVIKHKGYTIKVYTDNDPENPRNWDNLGTMVCFHRRYNLGDEHGLSKDEAIEITKRKDVVWLPIYAYEHGGITISTSRDYPYNDAWDSGQLGFIYVDYATIRKEYHWALLTKGRINKIVEYLRAEVEVYDDYLTGSVYGYKVEDEHGNEIDSCWGFYGYDHKKSGLLEAAKDAADHHHKTTYKQLSLI
jgi:hypothetical protein